EKNDSSAMVEAIETILSRERKISKSLPAFSEIQRKLESERNVIAFPVRKAIYLSIAASMLAAISITWDKFQFTDKPQNVALSAKVTFVSGDVKYRSKAENEFVVLKNGSEITESETIATGANSTVDLWLSHGTSIRIKSNSEVSIKKLIPGEDGAIELSLGLGKIFAHIHKNKKKSEFSVVTPTAIAGVRGTKFSVEVADSSDKKIVRISVAEGRVALTKAVNEIPVEPAGEQVIEPGQKIELLNTGFRRSLVGTDEKTELAEIDSLYIDEVQKKKLTGVTTEAALKEEYNRFEKITLDDKTILRGVIIDQDESHMTVHTPKGEIRIEKSKVVQVENVH
ncbi:MAG: FecR domain-containing protein, partial [Leptospira sp.]|nr:FecR domain-containing protein [Leptospira sp.]